MYCSTSFVHACMSHVLHAPILRSCFVFAVLSTVNCGNSECRFTWRAEPFLGQVAPTRPETSAEVEELLHSDYRADTKARLTGLQDSMRTTFQALPKTEYGFLGVGATRYLLHRHFRRSRGWLVRGLTPDGSNWNSTLPTAFLRDKTPGSVTELFEHRLLRHGLDLSEIALLAAMIENQVHQDTVNRLRNAWKVQHMPTNGKVAYADAERVLDTYMMGYIDKVVNYTKLDEVSAALSHVEEIYPNWKKHQAFVRALLRRSAPSHAREVSFQDLERVVVDASEHYVKFKSEECDSLKLDLLAIEGRRLGRVNLRDFFRKALDEDKYQFGESVEYMRDAGLLDETEPSSPSIIIPNYIDSPSQLTASSDNYAVSCPDECEDILGKIERQVAAAYATPSQIEILLASWGARGMSGELKQLLHDVAAANAGSVPLHSRLFAQWLHHVYPRECAYPQLPGSTRPMEPDIYEELKGENTAHASREEMVAYSSPQDTQAKHTLNEEIPWDPTEDLLAPRVALRAPLLPAFLIPCFHVAACITVLALLIPNLAVLQGMSSATQRKQLSVEMW